MRQRANIGAKSAALVDTNSLPQKRRSAWYTWRRPSGSAFASSDSTSNGALAVSPNDLSGTADPRLLGYLAAVSDGEARRHLESLLADPILPAMRRALARWRRPTVAASAARGQRLPAADDLFDDCLAQAALRLLTQMNRWREGRSEAVADTNVAALPPLPRDLAAYAASVAVRAAADWVRHRAPERDRLRHRLRYLLRHTAGFSLWTDEAGSSVVGFATWQASARTTSIARLLALLAALEEPDPRTALITILHPSLSRRGISCPASPEEAPAGAVVAAILDTVGEPLLFETLADLLTPLWSVQESAVAAGAEDSGVGSEVESVPARLTDAPDATVLRRTELCAVWAEVKALPSAHAAALLLNLRDPNGRGVLALLPLLGIARPEEIAAAMGMTPIELANLWDSLPVEDVVIAEQFGISRQQVINLRRTARERLQRRLAVTA